MEKIKVLKGMVNINGKRKVVIHQTRALVTSPKGGSWRLDVITQKNNRRKFGRYYKIDNIKPSIIDIKRANAFYNRVKEGIDKKPKNSKVFTIILKD